MKKTVLSQSLLKDSSDTESGRKFIKHEIEVRMVRQMLRNSTLYMKPHYTGTIESVSGKDLYQGMGRLSLCAKRNYNEFKNRVAQEKCYVRQKIELYCLTPKEHEKITAIGNKNKIEIAAAIKEMIDMMPDRDFALVYKEEVYDKFCTPKSKLDRTKKPELLSFYHEAANYLEMQLTCS